MPSDGLLKTRFESPSAGVDAAPRPSRHCHSNRPFKGFPGIREQTATATRAVGASRSAGTLLLALGIVISGLLAQESAPQSASRLSKAASLIQQGNLTGATEILSNEVRARPNDVDALVMLGSALSLVPRRSEAVETLLRAIELSPDEAWVHEAAGAAFVRLGEQDAALQVFERAVALDSGLGAAHLNIALILASKEEFDRAADHMAEALSLETDRHKRARLHFLTGKLHVEQSQLERAGGQFRRTIELDPTLGEAYLALGITLKRLLKEEEAFPMFRQAVELAPDDAAARYQLALELQRRGDAESAADHFLRAHELQPSDQSVVYNLTRALHKAGRQEESVKYRELLSRMIASDNRARENELESARLHGEAVRLEKAGNYAEALDKYRAVLQFEPLNAVARRNLALVLCRLDRWDEGIEELEAILRDNPDDIETARAHAIVLDQAREHEGGSVLDAGKGR